MKLFNKMKYSDKVLNWLHVRFLVPNFSTIQSNLGSGMTFKSPVKITCFDTAQSAEIKQATPHSH